MRNFPPEPQATAVSFANGAGERLGVHHPQYGADGDNTTCFRSGYHTAPWWQLSLDSLHEIRQVELYGKSSFGIIGSSSSILTPGLETLYSATISDILYHTINC